MSRFDTPIERRGSNSYKWDGVRRVFGHDGLLPFWVADMDFATPEPIIAALRERLQHPLLGYEERSDDYVDAILDWLGERHGLDVPREWLMFCPPSSIVGIGGMILTMTTSGSSIAMPTPTYGPLIDLVEHNGRRLLRNPLREADGRFELDIAQLQATVRDDTRMILLCNPHNPTGRVFARDELAAIAELAAARDLVVVADEVHCDLLMPGHRHCPFVSLGHAKSVSVISPNKTFNTAGVPQTTLIVPDERLRRAFHGYLDTLQLNHDSTFGAAAMIAAYRECAGWLDELIDYVDGNHRLVAAWLADNVPGVRAVPAEATYLAWLDCRALGLSEQAIMQRLADEGGVALYAGSEFGREGLGFLRMNVACPRTVLQRGLEGIKRALT